MLLFCYFLLLLLVVVVVVVVGYSFSITACFYLRDIHRDHFMETARVRFLSVRAGGCVVFRNSMPVKGGEGEGYHCKSVFIHVSNLGRV